MTTTPRMRRTNGTAFPTPAPPMRFAAPPEVSLCVFLVFCVAIECRSLEQKDMNKEKERDGKFQASNEKKNDATAALAAARSLLPRIEASRFSLLFRSFARHGP